jgi:membrane glycosyltransferase
MMTKRFWVRLLLNLLIAGTTLGGAYMFSRLLWSDGGTVMDVVLLLIFTLLYLWLSIAFWIATLGLILSLFDGTPAPFRMESVDQRQYQNLPPTAVIMPIYNEDPSRVFSGLLATYESVRQTGQPVQMDFFALSDTNDPEIWTAEELAWATARRAATGPYGFYYRRRQKNIGRKSGNVRDFCQRWGGAYKYMIILDADSVMEGWTILEMIRRMERHERLGILQAAPVPVSRETLFARVQQFVARVYGGLYVRGYAFWSQDESNYWGHNAIIRIEAFTKYCGLPRLPGRGPLGGEILSHDFVEAALMLRAGWEVRLAGDLGGSYEEPPTTLIDFVGRSRRWCQGNLQHLRLIALHGFHAISRIYFGMGAMSYLSSLLWLVFIVLTLINGVGAPSHSATSLWMMTLALLFLPKAWGYIALLLDRIAMKAHGGAVRAMMSVFLEAVISVLTAPIFMLFNVRFVVTLLSGRGIQWNPQRRDDTTVTFAEALHHYGLHTVVGVIGVLLLIWAGTLGQLWLLAVLVGLLLSVPLEMCLSSVHLGRRMRDAGLFLGREESEPPQVLSRQHILRRQIQQVLAFHLRCEPFRRLVLDAGLNDMHIALLRAQGVEGRAWDKIESLARVALHGGPEHLTSRDRLALLSSREAIAWLHREAWKRWKIRQRA